MKEKKVEVAKAEKAKEEAKKAEEEKKSESPKKATKKAEKSVKKTEEKVEKKAKKVTKKKLPEEIHTINLRSAYDKPRSRRAAAAINVIREYVSKHKRKEAVISPELNTIIWDRGIEKPPRKIRVKLVIGSETVTVYPAK